MYLINIYKTSQTVWNVSLSQYLRYNCYIYAHNEVYCHTIPKYLCLVISTAISSIVYCTNHIQHIDTRQLFSWPIVSFDIFCQTDMLLFYAESDTYILELCFYYWYFSIMCFVKDTVFFPFVLLWIITKIMNLSTLLLSLFST